ncbi:AAA family ATPase [Adhaeribacter radiodurans]|uniref:AAA family ATPase n=1 Tax=Adhaeribacter radiodurans TaxID=2745197 RepID=A0A7L7LDJ5_9BACT|nr:AAA family ATPase [Adhaeribacter radiodurans]QMU30908.1 AAA family ATPase [Adhaeribacter radiodurans]
MNGNRERTIYFITGASGAGKTTLITQLENKYKSKPWEFFHFDSIGVPSVPEMINEFGSPSGWQEAKTYEWIDRILQEHEKKKIFLEGQVNLEFIRAGFAKQGFNEYTIILLDCSEEEMRKRLTYNRRQPGLFTADMKNWLKYLRKQAEELGTPRIDTSLLSEKEVLQVFEEIIKL